MLISHLTVLLLIWYIKGIVGIRNVQLLVPPLVKAGGSATLLCLFDLEDAPLYSVKWYRGQHEFFRFMPTEHPPTKVFQIPASGIYVDVFSSNQYQVTLHNLPTYVSGEISCEITTDAPAFSTVCVSEMLNVRRLNIDLTVPKTQYDLGERLVAECTTSTAAKMSFYLNSLRVSGDFVTQDSPNRATINISLTNVDFIKNGILRLQCSGGISDQYYISTKNVNITSTLISSSSSNILCPAKLLLVNLLYLSLLLFNT